MGAGHYTTSCVQETRTPEVVLAEALSRDLGVIVDPQALRIFIRWRWDQVQSLAHQIHEA